MSSTVYCAACDAITLAIPPTIVQSRTTAIPITSTILASVASTRAMNATAVASTAVMNKTEQVNSIAAAMRPATVP